MCAAACIATIARSFGALHGLERCAALLAWVLLPSSSLPPRSLPARLLPRREHLDYITQAYTTDLYMKLGITGLEKSTAKVGNLTLKRAIRLFVFPGRPRWQLVPVDFDVHFGAGDDPALRNTLRWERLNRDLKSGTRFLFHSNNHYARIFGVRELKNETHRSALPDEGTVVYALPPKTAAPTPPAPNAGTVGPSTAPPPTLPVRSLADGGDSDNEDDPVEISMASDSKENQAGASHIGSAAGKPLPALAAPGHIAPITAPERPARSALPAASTPAVAPTGSATPLAEAKPGCKLVSWLRSGREILMARSGQSPKHWVDWDQVCRSIDTHRIQTIIAVRWVERAGGTT